MRTFIINIPTREDRRLMMDKQLRANGFEIPEEGKKNEEGFSTIYLKMTGNTENPEISFDRIRIREKLKESIANEKEEVTRIIKQEVLQKDSSYIKEKNSSLNISSLSNGTYIIRSRYKNKIYTNRIVKG